MTSVKHQQHDRHAARHSLKTARQQAKQHARLARQQAKQNRRAARVSGRQARLNLRTSRGDRQNAAKYVFDKLTDEDFLEQAGGMASSAFGAAEKYLPAVMNMISKKK
jgi:hypothetical protein